MGTPAARPVTDAGLHSRRHERWPVATGAPRCNQTIFLGGKMKRDFPAFCLALAVALAPACASTSQGRAIQQTAVGGGFVAIGSTVAASTVVATGLSLVLVRDPIDTLSTFGGGALSAGVFLGIGAALMAAAANDLPGELPAPNAQQARPSRDDDVTKKKVPRREAPSRAYVQPEFEPRDESEFQPISSTFGVAAGHRGYILLFYPLVGDRCASAEIVTLEGSQKLNPYSRMDGAFRLDGIPTVQCSESVRVVACGREISLNGTECDAVTRLQRQQPR
jgi:hypothetical protein